MSINEGRIERLSRQIGKLGLGGVMRFEEEDPQFKAITMLCSEVDACNALVLTVLNSLVSYQLTGKGEDHWFFFAKYFAEMGIKDPCASFIEYTMRSRYLARFREGRLSRVSRVCGGIREILHDCGSVMTEPVRILGILRRSLGLRGDEKTLVFSVKMAYYVSRGCAGMNLRLPMEIPIPVDVRVGTLGLCSGIVGLGVNDWRRARAILTRERGRYWRLIQEAWQRVAVASGVPPLHLDSLIWVLGGYLMRNDFSITRTVNELRGLGIPNLRELVVELAHACARD